MKRRDFLKTSAQVAAAVALLPMGTSKILQAMAVPLVTTQIPFKTLNNGVQMPMLGFGTLTLNDEMGANCVSQAIALGYRLLDTARIYGNEAAVGKGILKSKVDRRELFITSKLWVDDYGYESAKKAFETTLKKLGTDYLDLYLIHRPRGDVKGSWQAMEELYQQGKIKAIGVSNFENHHLNELLAYAKVKPAINQIETHAFFQQHVAQTDLSNFEIQMEGWAPFAEGRNDLFTNPVLNVIGSKYNKTNAQVSLRWLFQRGIITIPRTSKKEHMIENLNVFDFELDASEMEIITKLDLNKTQFPEWD